MLHTMKCLHCTCGRTIRHRLSLCSVYRTAASLSPVHYLKEKEKRTLKTGCICFSTLAQCTTTEQSSIAMLPFRDSADGLM